MGARDLSGSLMVMVTYACQLRCGYCEVLKVPRTMPWATLRKSVDLLLTAGKDRLHLRYFGGEPLLRFDLVQRAIGYAERRQKPRGKKIRHMITTNGVLLDPRKIAWLSRHDVEVMLSLDGPGATQRRQRPSASGRDTQARLRANLKALQRSGIPYFVNTVVRPGGHHQARTDLELMASWGVRRAQICYQVATPWDAAQTAGLLDLTEAAVEGWRGGGGMEILNLNNGCEPVMLSDEILVDTDGEIYLDGAIFLERSFPRLREFMRLGSLEEGPGMADLQRSKAEVLRLVKECYPPDTVEGRLFLNNLGLGLEVGRRMSGLQRAGARR